MRFAAEQIVNAQGGPCVPLPLYSLRGIDAEGARESAYWTHGGE
jgi:hypothetical protein